MRRIVCLGVVMLLGSLVPVNVLAQKQQSQSATQELNIRTYIDLLRSDLRANRTVVIAKVMQFNDKDAVAFWPIYREYESELARLYDEKVAGILDYTDHYTQMTDEKADDLTLRALQWENQRTELKKKYYKRFKHALSAITAARFLQVENQIQMLVDLQVASSLPIVEGQETSKQ